MAYQIIITLTDVEYQALSVEAAKNGKSVESLLHEVLVQHIKPSVSVTGLLTNRQIQEYLYREGVIEHIPTNESETMEEETEREHLAHLFSQGKLASEMVIEDRGPR